MAALCLGQTPKSHFGFDKNDYPGDALLPALRRSFSYTGYWLNNPPGENSNSWTGKRATLKANGFGFMILYNGRLDAELKGKDAAALGPRGRRCRHCRSAAGGLCSRCDPVSRSGRGRPAVAGAERLPFLMDRSGARIAVQAGRLLFRHPGSGRFKQDHHCGTNREP